MDSWWLITSEYLSHYYSMSKFHWRKCLDPTMRTLLTTYQLRKAKSDRVGSTLPPTSKVKERGRDWTSKLPRELNKTPGINTTTTTCIRWRKKTTTICTKWITTKDSRCKVQIQPLSIRWTTTTTCSSTTCNSKWCTTLRIWTNQTCQPIKNSTTLLRKSLWSRQKHILREDLHKNHRSEPGITLRIYKWKSLNTT